MVCYSPSHLQSHIHIYTCFTCWWVACKVWHLQCVYTLRCKANQSDCEWHPGLTGCIVFMSAEPMCRFHTSQTYVLLLQPPPCMECWVMDQRQCNAQLKLKMKPLSRGFWNTGLLFRDSLHSWSCFGPLPGSSPETQLGQCKKESIVRALRGDVREDCMGVPDVSFNGFNSLST